MSTLRRSARVASRPVKQPEPEEQGPVTKKPKLLRHHLKLLLQLPVELKLVIKFQMSNY